MTEQKMDQEGDGSEVDVVRLVMGAHLPDGVARTAATVGYSRGVLAEVMRPWVEQPYRSWLARELSLATGLAHATVGRVVRDLLAAGHAVAAESPRVLGGRYRRGSYVLTPKGLDAWRAVDLEVERRYVAPHRAATPRTPLL